MSRIKKVNLLVSQPFPEPTETPPNVFGLYRRYTTKPSYDPDTVGVTMLTSTGSSSSSMAQTLGTDGARQNTYAKFRPFPNFSQYSFAKLWNNNQSGHLSDDFFNRTLKTVTDPQFSVSDLKGWSARKMKQQLQESKPMDQAPDANPDMPPEIGKSDDWHRNVKVPISIPEGKNSWTSPQGFKFEVPGLHYRSIISIVKKVYSTAKNLHFTPFELFLKKPGTDLSEDKRVYGELYSSPAYLQEQEHLNKLPTSPYERVIAPLMFWSDSTHLTSFGTAHLWPIYMFFGSQSKLLRGKPSEHLCHHLAYIPSLPDSIQDTIRQVTGGMAASGPLLTHCKRELMHGIWRILLDEEFCEAYHHGILIECADGIKRLVFPRIFTYSADYPEKVLLATIRDKGLCPCPRCYIRKEQIDSMGTDLDMARRQNPNHIRKDDYSRRYDVSKARSLIYEKGVPVNGKGVDNILKNTSRVPTMNAFSEKLQDKGFEYHSMFVVDFLHEIELGVWKAIFTHLIRVLYASQHSNRAKFRYRQIATFGGDTIRRFSNNVSEMKQLAARDFEDILQCAMPAFEGLLEEPYNKLLMDVLFTLCYWHGVAKLRMHTDETIDLLAQLTKQFGSLIRKFAKDTANGFHTVELPREKAARARRIASDAKKGKQVTARAAASTGKDQSKPLNLNTYKFHSMGDYPWIIRQFGSIESYSTQRGEQEHRLVKQRYSRASKKDTSFSLTQLERRDRHMRSITDKISQGQVDVDEELPAMKPTDHWSISSSQRRNRIDIGQFLSENEGDPATKDHLLARILGKGSDDDEITFTHKELMRVLIINDQMFEHARLRINYTSYDLRRCQDTLNPKGDHRDLMVLAQDDAQSASFHPFWYARLIGIYHVNVEYYREDGMLEPPRTMHFLWVRWFGRDSKYRCGPKYCRLDRIGFVHDEDDTDSFGFLDPARVIRAVHLIPAFNEGRTEELLGDSVARRYDELKDDWQFFYVNRFADRDMLMRYMGGGIGHSIHYQTETSITLDETITTQESEGELEPLEAARIETIQTESSTSEIDLLAEDFEPVEGEAEVLSEEEDTEDEEEETDEELIDDEEEEDENVNNGYDSP
ncbi:hypothetical protein M422DRAFT_170788 [Sphaerobolus stellatus SS14]|uniref:Uncharacterized protein n=1 Tax=Sphaerobolus stellatus (strain SS14) TaxID=990650 RepID=A0A0C9VVL2_SPHS4|nr:hypothetical protein M422DRAFT_170788 [Sphaerobolus stellatus SS14]